MERRGGGGCRSERGTLPMIGPERPRLHGAVAPGFHSSPRRLLGIIRAWPIPAGTELEATHSKPARIPSLALPEELAQTEADELRIVLGKEVGTAPKHTSAPVLALLKPTRARH